MIAALLLAGLLPNSNLTPGAVLPVTVQQVCVRGYSRTVRHPYDAAWRRFRVAVFNRYGIAPMNRRQYTLDHAVSLEIGGAPFDIRNVWPERKADALRKDRVEGELRTAVCTGLVTLQAAQSQEAANWTATVVGLPR